MRPADTELCERKKTDEELFAIARAHMEKYSGAASLDRGLWDATVRLALRPRTEALTPAGDLISIAAIQEEIVHITQNGIELAKYGGQDADEGRCRELCAMYLSEFILSHRLAQQLDALEAQRNELAVAAANRLLDAASSRSNEEK